MKENYTHITVILDRTGPVDSVLDDTIGGFDSDAVLAYENDSGGTPPAWKSTSSRIADSSSARSKKMVFLNRERERQENETERKQ